VRGCRHGFALRNKWNAAFFTMNGVISVVYFLFIAADPLLRR
jgi:hypothetical protein